MIAKIVVTPLVALACLATAFGQSQIAVDRAPKTAKTSYLHTIWTTEQGLPQNSVTAIIQTRDGYLWLGTFGGLARFDGVKFTVFDTGNSPGLAGNRVTLLYEDRAGNIWIGFEGGGLARYAQGKFTTYTMKDGLPDSRVEHISE